ncbi:MAG: hypothetical protein Q4A28_04765 [Brachymonas sp.]|nr:hypothetical protein [Brachymonas sp.]
MTTLPASTAHPAQQPQTFYCSWIHSLLQSGLLTLCGYVSSVAVLVLAQTYLNGHYTPFVAVGLFALLFLRATESLWFGLTCRRFATISHDELMVYGAFGRTRLHCRLNAARFYYGTGTSKDKRPATLLVEFPGGRLQRFSLSLCVQPVTFSKALGAVHRFAQEQQHAQVETAQLSQQQRQLRHAYALLVLVPAVGIAIVQDMLHVFWSMQLLPAAWYWGALAGAAATWPIGVWTARPLRHFRFMNLPDYHHWRRSAGGHAAAEALYYLKLAAILLCIGAAYSAFFAHNIAWLSLMPHTRQAASAHITARGYSEGCSRGKLNYTWKLQVQLPAPHTHFNGDWCSQRSVQSAPPAAGPHTVHLRESRFVRELTFEP